jgi:hypothetical protein
VRSVLSLKIFLVGALAIIAGRILFALVFGRIKTRGRWRQRGIDQSFGFVLKIEIAGFLFFLVPVTYVVFRLPELPPLWFQYAIMAEFMIPIAFFVGYIISSRKRQKIREAELAKDRLIEEMKFRIPK